MLNNMDTAEAENFPVKPKVKPPGRKSDAEYGRANRKHLTETEVRRLMKAAEKFNRHGKRDRLMIALAFHHGLRVSEVVDLRWSDIDLDAGTITVSRKKGGADGNQPLDPECHRWLTALNKARTMSLPWVFVTERNTQVSTDAFASQLKAAAAHAKIKNVHPHSLRHACGHALAEANLPAYKLQAFMGHKKAESTAVYIKSASHQHDDARRILSGKWR